MNKTESFSSSQLSATQSVFWPLVVTNEGFSLLIGGHFPTKLALIDSQEFLENPCFAVVSLVKQTKKTENMQD